MKYKLKYWTFGDYECEEMEDYLNGMAAKGYKLRTIMADNGASIISGWATFEKTENARRYRYGVDIVEEQDKESYLQICRDAGWTETAWSGDNICVFSTTSQGAKPIYENRASRFERMVEYNLEKYGSVNPYLYIGLILLGIAAMVGFVLWCINGWARGVTWYAFLFAMWMMYPLRRALSLMIIGFAERRRHDEPTTSFRPLRRFFSVATPALWLMSFIAIGVFTPLENFSYWRWIGITLIFFCFAISGSALGGYYNKKWIGAMFTAFAFVIFILVLIFIY